MEITVFELEMSSEVLLAGNSPLIPSMIWETRFLSLPLGCGEASEALSTGNGKPMAVKQSVISLVICGFYGHRE